MTKFQKILGLSTFVVIMSFSTFIGHAAPRDMKNIKTNKLYLYSDYSSIPSKLDELLLDLASGDTFSYEKDERIYDFDKIDSLIGEGKRKGKTVSQVFNDAKQDNSLLLDNTSAIDTPEDKVFDIKRIY